MPPDPPAAAGDVVFFGTEGGTFFAIDFVKNQPAWKAPSVPPGQSYRSSAAVAGDLVIVGTRGRAVEAFAVADGRRVWRHPTRGRVDGSPAVVARREDGQQGPEVGAALVAIVADSSGRIAAIATADGTAAWEFDAGGGFSAGPAVASGRVVIAGDDGTVWCFGESP
ncbi:MAG: hypothetical protein EBZ59_07300 [Planctomycetia bacterium]|nr:hypothetical protein [Planctomycetia bacterium]